jgi:hypothetical protein
MTTQSAVEQAIQNMIVQSSKEVQVLQTEEKKVSRVKTVKKSAKELRKEKEVAFRNAMLRRIEGSDSLDVDGFLKEYARSSSIDNSYRLALGFLNWLIQNQPKRLGAVNVCAPMGEVIEACKRIARTLKDPRWITPDQPKPDQAGIQFGSAGVNSSADKIFGHLKQMLLVIESECFSLVCEAQSHKERAIDARLAKDPESERDHEEKYVVASGKAAIEKARANSIRNIIETLNVAKATEMYENAGKRELVVTKVISRQFV